LEGMNLPCDWAETFKGKIKAPVMAPIM